MWRTGWDEAMSDLSVRLPNAGALRAMDSLLRSMGGFQVLLRMPANAAAGVDAEQLGLSSPSFQDLPLGPAVFRRTRVAMKEGQPPLYELLLSASAVGAQVSAMQAGSAEVLFAMATGITVAGNFYLIEATSMTPWLGSACVYRVLLRERVLQSEAIS
jgi:hypothetical protein